MPKVIKSESESEKFAREIVESHLGVKLEFFDFSGQVDYLASAGEKSKIALEVTSFTEQDKWELSKIDDGGKYLVVRHDLNHNWLINVQGVPNFLKLGRELLPRLVDLEIHRLPELHTSTQGWWLEKVPTLKNLFKAIRSNNVEHISSRIGNFRDQDENDPRLVAITSSENWIFGGVNSSLELVEDFLDSDTNDRQKLQKTGFPDRHIFVWIDKFSKREVREIFDQGTVKLPTRTPELPPEITHLWLADTITRKVMYFNSTLEWELISY
jgi:hypothetical protein